MCIRVCLWYVLFWIRSALLKWIFPTPLAVLWFSMQGGLAMHKLDFCQMKLNQKLCSRSMPSTPAASGHLVSWTDHLKSTQRRYHQLCSTNYGVCYLLTEAQPQVERLSDSVAVPVRSLFSLRHSTWALGWLCNQHQTLCIGAMPYTQKHSAAEFNPVCVYTGHCQPPACSISVSTNYFSSTCWHLGGHKFHCSNLPIF